MTYSTILGCTYCWEKVADLMLDEDSERAHILTNILFKRKGSEHVIEAHPHDAPPPLMVILPDESVAYMVAVP